LLGFLQLLYCGGSAAEAGDATANKATTQPATATRATRNRATYTACAEVVSIQLGSRRVPTETL
jgi:hypothetical protein